MTTELNQANGYPLKWVDKEWYFDGKNKLSTYDIILDKIILKNFEIDNPSSLKFAHMLSQISS